MNADKIVGSLGVHRCASVADSTRHICDSLIQAFTNFAKIRPKRLNHLQPYPPANRRPHATVKPK